MSRIKPGNSLYFEDRNCYSCISIHFLNLNIYGTSESHFVHVQLPEGDNFTRISSPPPVAFLCPPAPSDTLTNCCFGNSFYFVTDFEGPILLLYVDVKLFVLIMAFLTDHLK